MKLKKNVFINAINMHSGGGRTLMNCLLKGLIYRKEEVLRSVSEELAETEKEKLSKLSEGIDYEDDTQYQEKLEILKENYFQKTETSAQPLTEEVENNNETEESETKLNDVMSQ